MIKYFYLKRYLCFIFHFLRRDCEKKSCRYSEICLIRILRRIKIYKSVYFPQKFICNNQFIQKVTICFNV